MLNINTNTKKMSKKLFKIPTSDWVGDVRQEVSVLLITFYWCIKDQSILNTHIWLYKSILSQHTYMAIQIYIVHKH